MSNCTSIDFTYCTLSMAVCSYDLQLLPNGVASKGKQSCTPTKKAKCTQPHQSFANPRTHLDSTATSSVRQHQQAVTTACLQCSQSGEKNKSNWGEEKGLKSPIKNAPSIHKFKLQKFLNHVLRNNKKKKRRKKSSKTGAL